MNLNRLPVLIRTEVTAAAKGASLPAVYSRALAVLEEAVSELSFAKLKNVEVSAVGLAAWAKAHQDTRLSETARELKFRARRTANYIAEQLVKQRRAAFIARGGSFLSNSLIPSKEPESGGVCDILQEAGYKHKEVDNIRRAARAPDEPVFAQMNDNQLALATRGAGTRRKIATPIYFATFTDQHSPLSRASWLRDNNARGIARQLSDQTEIYKARQTVTLLRAWCDEFLKNLPRPVSKGKAS